MLPMIILAFYPAISTFAVQICIYPAISTFAVQIAIRINFYFIRSI